MSRPSPAHMLTIRIGPGGAASNAARMHSFTTASRRTSGVPGRSYAVCHSCQSCAARVIGQNHRMTHRVVQWATGLLGKEAIKGVLAHPELELVGCWVHRVDKAGA